eukprot:CFRG3097T1
MSSTSRQIERVSYSRRMRLRRGYSCLHSIFVAFLIITVLFHTCVSAGKPSKKSKSTLGVPCQADADCVLTELYCKLPEQEQDDELKPSPKPDTQENLDEKSKVEDEAVTVTTSYVKEKPTTKGACAMKLGLGHKCASSNMCLSNYCGIDNDCEFSSRQIVVIAVILGAFGILMMAASSPPNYNELHPQGSKAYKKVLWRKKLKISSPAIQGRMKSERTALYSRFNPSRDSNNSNAGGMSIDDNDDTMELGDTSVVDTDEYEEISKTHLFSDTDDLEIVRATSVASFESEFDESEKTELGGLRLGKSASALVKPGHESNIRTSPKPRKSIIDRGISLFEGTRRQGLTLHQLTHSSKNDNEDSDSVNEFSDRDSDEEEYVRQRRQERVISVPSTRMKIETKTAGRRTLSASANDLESMMKKNEHSCPTIPSGLSIGKKSNPQTIRSHIHALHKNTLVHVSPNSIDTIATTSTKVGKGINRETHPNTSTPPGSTSSALPTEIDFAAM